MAPVARSSRGREKQRSSFIWFFHYTKTFLGLPNFPSAHKYDPGDMPHCLCGSDVSLHGRRDSVTLSSAFPSLPTLAVLASPVEYTADRELSASQTAEETAKEHGRALDCGSVFFFFSLYFQLRRDLHEIPHQGLNKWSGRFRTAHKLSDLKASFQVVLCSLV